MVNLSPDKARVLSEAYRVLKPGGEFFFSDVYADRRVPEAAQKDEVIYFVVMPIIIIIIDYPDSQVQKLCVALGMLN